MKCAPTTFVVQLVEQENLKLTIAMNQDNETDRSVNPFSEHDTDRHQIWEILMRHDFEAFAAGDWSMAEPDFWEEGFSGVDARKEPEPAQWRLTFPDLASYRDEWLRQVQEFGQTRLVGTTIRDFLYESCALKDIEINRNRAIVRKMFDGQATTVEGREINVRFQSLYQLMRRDGQWQIEGFVGYLPNPMPTKPANDEAETPW